MIKNPFMEYLRQAAKKGRTKPITTKKPVKDSVPKHGIRKKLIRS